MGCMVHDRVIDVTRFGCSHLSSVRVDLNPLALLLMHYSYFLSRHREVVQVHTCEWAKTKAWLSGEIYIYFVTP